MSLARRNSRTGAVEFHGLGGAHAEDLDADDVQAGAGEKVDDVAGAAGGEAEVVGLDKDEGALGFFAGFVGDDVFEDAAVLVGEAGPEFEFGFGFLGGGGGEDGGFKITDFAVFAEDDVAVCIAYGFAAIALVADVADDGAGFADGVFAAQEEDHDAAAAAGFGVGGKVLQDVVVDEFLDFFVLRVVGGDDGGGVFLHEFRAGGEHPGGDEFEAGAGDEAADDAASAGFVQGIGRDDDVGELL